MPCDGRWGWCGPAWRGPARHGSVQGGPARHGVAQGGPARHGSDQGGPARHGSARRLWRGGDGGRRGDGGPARTGCTLSYLHRLLLLLKSGLHVGKGGESVQEINSVCETSFFLLTVCDSGASLKK